MSRRTCMTSYVSDFERCLVVMSTRIYGIDNVRYRYLLNADELCNHHTVVRTNVCVLYTLRQFFCPYSISWYFIEQRMSIFHISMSTKSPLKF